MNKFNDRTKINKYLISDYIIDILIPVLKICEKHNFQIGHRTFNLIKKDIHLLPFTPLYCKNEKDTSYWVSLIASDIDYINNLEDVFEMLMSYLIKK